LRIRQKDAETLRRLAELNAAWVATARVIAKAGVGLPQVDKCKHCDAPIEWYKGAIAKVQS
jgi:hypothetical protein